jgi:low affinity Fe/Cu permease
VGWSVGVVAVGVGCDDRRARTTRVAGSELRDGYLPKVDILDARKTDATGADKAPFSEAFRRLACVASNRLGSHWAFMAAVAVIVGWAVTGPLFRFSETWQLVINTGTTIVTFLMVFLIQSTQNRDAKAIHLKLDELIRSSKARDVFADLENATEEELDSFQREFEQLRRRGLSAGKALVEAHLNTPQASQSP